MKLIVQQSANTMIIMTTKTLHRHTPNELRITYTNNEIIVENLQQLKAKEELIKNIECFKQTLFMMVLAFLLGVCITYLILT